MGSSKAAFWGDSSLRITWVLTAAVILVMTGIVFMNMHARQSLSSMAFNTSLSNDMAAYRYKFGGAVNTHYLNEIVSVSIYRRPEEIDQVVFTQRNTDYYVLNADVMVDYRLSPEGSIEIEEKMNALFHHYDPYLQGEKQEMHRQWTIEQYQKYAGRMPTDEEWLAALNELTRGVEHYQMQRWIAYSPPAIAYWLANHLPKLIGRMPNEEETIHLTELLQAGITYEQIESRIGIKQPQG